MDADAYFFEKHRNTELSRNTVLDVTDHTDGPTLDLETPIASRRSLQPGQLHSLQPVVLTVDDGIPGMPNVASRLFFLFLRR